MLVACDIESLKAVKRVVDRTVGNAEISRCCIRSIVTDDDVLTRRDIADLDVATLCSVHLAVSKVNAAREVEVEVLDGERIGCIRQLRRLRLDLHVGLAVRARLVRSFELDMTRRLDV